MKGLFAIILSLVAIQGIYAQKIKKIETKNQPVICYARFDNCASHVDPPQEYINQKNSRVQSASIEVTYVGNFPPAAKTAFDHAVSIWETIISSPVPIKIQANWSSLPSGVLGSAIYWSAYANFDGAQKINVFYPVALAEKIAGEELNDADEFEIFASFSSSINWYFGTDGAATGSQFDFVTVVLHEIGHGLGFSSSFEVEGSLGQVGAFGTSVPIIFDIPIENGSATKLVQGFSSSSTALKTQLTSNNLKISLLKTPPGGTAQLFAPSTFDGGSSISHLNESTYGSGTSNALMTPQIGFAEVNHNPGPLAMGILSDLGWEQVRIVHQPLVNTENEIGPYTVTVSVTNDEAAQYNPDQVKINYTLDGTNFSSATMNNLGSNQFNFNFPVPPNIPATYGYYISVGDNVGRTILSPGKTVRIAQPEVQHLYTFEIGPDIQSPKITHNQKPFLLESDTELVVDAKITDNINVASSYIEYSINNGQLTTLPITLSAPEEDSIYTCTIVFSSPLAIGDVLRYQIFAEDNALAGPNQTVSPLTNYYSVNVVGLLPTQDSYANDFSVPTSDFFGAGFEIKSEAGFTNGALHSEHPYLEGNGFPGDKHELIYQLSIPIRIKNVDATLSFDEIVLVEPGETGSVFGDEDFYDYVVVEGSKDGGITWTPVADGYDSRANSAWLSRYNSSISDNNSTATGIPSLFKPRTMNLLQKFSAGDEVVIRFRLFSDPFATGWGWCIDNLKIQIDETPPQILHNHTDYIFDTEDALQLVAKTSDASGINEFKIEYFVNDNPIESFLFPTDLPQDEYIFNLTGLMSLSVGDTVNYRFVSTDKNDNTSYLPSEGYIVVPVVDFSSESISTYSNNFNTASTDFVGNFFSITKPSGFANQAIQSTHFYNNGFGLTKTSNFSYTLKKPIRIADQNTYIRFDEIVLVQAQSSGILFGTEAFNDYVVVEGSKDGGETWSRFLDGYDALGQMSWVAAFNNESNGAPSLFKTRAIDMTQNGNFSSGDEVIIRFRMYSDATTNGWGWAIDNLYIQDPITPVENESAFSLSVYPNPTKGNITVEAFGIASPYFNIQLLNPQGQPVYSNRSEVINGKFSHLIPTDELTNGVYFIKVYNEGSLVIKKVIKI